MVPSRTQEHSYSRTRQQLPPSAPRIQTRPARSHDITRKGSHIDLRTGDWLRRRGHSLTRDKHVIPYRGLGVIGQEGNKVHIIEETEMGRGATFWQPASLAETAAGEALGQATQTAVCKLAAGRLLFAWAGEWGETGAWVAFWISRGGGGGGRSLGVWWAEGSNSTQPRGDSAFIRPRAAFHRRGPSSAGGRRSEPLRRRLPAA